VKLFRPRHWLALLSFCCALILYPAQAQDAPPTDPAPIEPAATDALEGDITVPVPTRAVRYPPETSVDGEHVRLELFFRAIPQATTALIRLTLRDDNAALQITSARARFLDKFIDFFSSADGFYALLAPSMEQNMRSDLPLDIFVTYDDGSRESFTTPVAVTVGGFIRQAVTLPPQTMYLIDAATERSELVQLGSIFTPSTETRYWAAEGFRAPLNAVLTSPFGAFRTFNESFNTRHTGWDFRVTLGTPISASAAGQVVFAADLPIRGSHIVIDHGYGVYTGYSHLSVTHVTRGQLVAQGQIIGMAGAGGRVSGPHFHWEVAVNGDFVDGAQFISMWLPP